MDITESKNNLLKIIRLIHQDCFKLCKIAVGKYLPVAGNMGVFTHFQEEFQKFDEVRKELCYPSDNPKTKYFELKESIIIPKSFLRSDLALGPTYSQVEDLPETGYTHLYVKKPDPDLPKRGDIDFVLPRDEYQKLRARIEGGEKIPGAKIYERAGWDMVELAADDINSYAYITYQQMAEKARVRFD